MTQWGSLGIQAGAPCRVFVSYAHLDELVGGWPKRFMQELKNLLPVLRSRGVSLTAEQIFYDADRLLQVECWSQAIAKALDECEVFILLVSSHALASRHCIPTELQTVVKRGVPVVPVLLHPTGGWIKRPVFDDQPKPTLGDFHSGGLPMGAGNNVQAISSWPNVESAWEKVSENLLTFLERFLPHERPMAPEVMATGFRPPAIPSELLPYFCDQQPLETAYRKLVEDWREQAGWALVVLYRGREHDGLTALGRRLRHKWLAPMLPALGERGPMDWPDPEGEDLLPLCVARLFDALQLPPPPRQTDAAAAQLADALRGRHSTPHLHGTLMPLDSGALLKPFMQFLEDVAALVGPSSAGLIIDLKLELPRKQGLNAVPSLLGATPPRGQRVWLRELDPPAALTRDHVVKWRDHFDAQHRLCPDALDEACRPYFDPPARAALDWLRPWKQPTAPELRLGDFAKLVKPLMSRSS